MKILFTGGGTGGHFYPIVAVAEEIKKQVVENKLVEAELYFMSPTPYNAGILYERGIRFIPVAAGKQRTYFSILNFFDLFKTGWGIMTALWKVFNLYPDVVFSKGGYTSFPVLVAARILRIPVVIHESDSVPGKVNQWSGKFAARIAVSFPDAAAYFPKDRVALTGNPVRTEIALRSTEGAREFFSLEPNIPVILVLGGSQGSKIINDSMTDALPELLKKYQVLHQSGKNNFVEAKETADVVLLNDDNKPRYHLVDYFNTVALRHAAGSADLVISRAGSTIFEIAAWGLPSIIIPIRESRNDHQAKNAYAYARAGACQVVEEMNLTSNILAAEVSRILDNVELRGKMAEAAKAFFRPRAAEAIALEILKIAAQHGG
jgi:UDP-N-acetylglucosamine--N-acetylmuramyl-(pentapeptide) pyrophosphoryl-undecaprenol N-acetylglucosamine transferase